MADLGRKAVLYFGFHLIAYGRMVNLLVATFDGNQMLFPPTDPSSKHSPGAKKRTQRPSIEQTVVLLETMVGSIVKPSVGCFDDAKK